MWALIFFSSTVSLENNTRGKRTPKLVYDCGSVMTPQGNGCVLLLHCCCFFFCFFCILLKVINFRMNWIIVQHKIKEERRKILPKSGWHYFPLGIYISIIMLYRCEHKRVLHFICRSRWPRGLRHEMSSPARTLGSWVGIPRMDVYFYSVFMCGQIPRPRSPTDCVRLRNWSETSVSRMSYASSGSNRSVCVYIYIHIDR
jgi:hypothetical protein